MTQLPVSVLVPVYNGEDTLAGCIESVRKAAETVGLPAMELVSGAGHDAVYVARIAPTSMIFIPCEGGLSHNELENAKESDVIAGANVLLHAVLDQAGVTASPVH